MTKMKYVIFSIIMLFLVVMGIAMVLSQMKYHVIVKEYSEHGIVKSSNDKTSFLKSIVRGYRKVIDNEVDKSFYDKLPLYKCLSARYFISSYGESILYIYPSTEESIRIDYLDKPAQVLLSHGFIDLNNPESDIHPEKLLPIVSRDEAVAAYQKIPSNILAGEGDARDSAYIGGEGSLRLDNFLKIIQFVSPESMMTICTEKLIISTSDSITKSIYGRDMEFSYTLNGPLIISNIIEFSNVSDIGENIGVSLAEMHIKQLAVKSKTFKFYIDDKKLKPFAEEIVEKLKRSESNPLLYPLWKFKDDLQKIHAYAKKEGISSGYVDDLIAMLKTGAMTGTLLTYYKNSHEFVIQWLLINAIIFMCMMLLVFIRLGDTSLVNYIAPFLKSIYVEKLLLSAIVFTINGWVFFVKPAHLDIRFWIIPGISILTNLCVSGYIQKYFMK